MVFIELRISNKENKSCRRSCEQTPSYDQVKVLGTRSIVRIIVAGEFEFRSQQNRLQSIEIFLMPFVDGSQSNIIFFIITERLCQLQQQATTEIFSDVHGYDRVATMEWFVNILLRFIIDLDELHISLLSVRVCALPLLYCGLFHTLAGLVVFWSMHLCELHAHTKHTRVPFCWLLSFGARIHS